MDDRAGLLEAARRNPESFSRASEKVFRRLLSNLLLDVTNDRFHEVRQDNALISANLEGISGEHVSQLFAALGYQLDETCRTYKFTGSSDVLKSADKLFSALEDAVRMSRQDDESGRDLLLLHELRRARTAKMDHSRGCRPTLAEHAAAQPRRHERVEARGADESASHTEKLDESVYDAVTRTLLTSGRVRNSFFDRKHYVAYRMTQKRAYFCTEKCSPAFIEAHWHLFCGKTLLYAHIAHLSEDGSQLVHTGPEYGYQYDSLPGSPNFRKTILFSEKVTSPQGHLTRNEHPNKLVTHCQYCGECFAKLFI